jgi:CubicO group peptidase (beta-lactamase class C family)
MKPPRRRAAAVLAAFLAAVLGLALFVAGPAFGWPPRSRGTVRGPLGAALDAYLRRLERFGYSGSVLVARRGEIVLDRGYGIADDATGEPFTAGTLFDVASVSKQFTAAAILKLEMQGRLHVEDPLSRFFPGVPPDKADITLHQLLTHTSGMPDVLGAEYEPLSRDQMLRRAFAAKLQQAPGKRFRYSNAGYSVLAAVAEVASGRPLGELMRNDLFLPAGMRHTGFRLPFWDRRPLAHGDSADGPWGTPLDHRWAADGPYWNLRGNGGVLSTTGDLYRWHLALAGDTVLSAAERAKLQEPHVREGPNADARYAYGWYVAQADDGTRLISHTGGNGAFDTDVRRYLDDQVVLIASSNHAAFSAVAMTPHLESRIFGKPDPEPPAPRHLAPAELARCAGTYRLAAGDTLRVSVADPHSGGLLVAADSPAGFALLLAGQSQDDQDILDERADKVSAALVGAQHGDYKPLATLIGLPIASVETPFRATLNLFQHQLGNWTGATVLGSISTNGDPYTYARFTFEHGTRLAQYRWGGPTVETVRFPDRPLGYLYLPVAAPPPDPAPAQAPAAKTAESSVHFAAYDVHTGIVRRLRCALPAAQGQGPPIALYVATPQGEVAAAWSGR